MKNLSVPLTQFRLLAFAAVIVAAPPASAARRSDDALSLIPPDAASVAVVRFNELRSSPLAAKLFAEADHITVDGDAARFMEEAKLNPKWDVDTVVIAGMPPSGTGETSGLALFEGRFDPDRLSAAVASRGGVRKTAPAGDYYLLPEKESESGRRGKPGAVAFVSRHLVIAGTESAVLQALAARGEGGTAFSTGSGLGRHLNRIDRGASVWALVDMRYYPLQPKGSAHIRVEGEVNGEPVVALLGAMKSVSLFAFEAATRGDALDLSASGLSSDEETRQLLEDSLRGVLAIWRLAVQEKSPELVSVLRKFKIRNDGQAVSVSGTLPGGFLRSLAEKADKKRGENR